MHTHSMSSTLQTQNVMMTPCTAECMREVRVTTFLGQGISNCYGKWMNKCVLQDLLVMRFKELEHKGQLGTTFGDVEVAGIKQHELMDWYFAHQAERCAAPWLPRGTDLGLRL